ncbi:tetratricopeptide repeat protein [Leucothrix pacifica]|uniref:Uncharacterized protein n=1 Tax=Leucothrix pacifica TaxID=1247513 RepID=A0A317CI79_9GAMM|nr:tetratricopeptide repeat protein [Leucothrix pacifica]PWQ97977.1 hypothetical protein DKW60_09130 [Leucothrix pacifica]
MPFFILSVIVQIAFVIHIMKTGRNTTWIWVVMMLPGAGAAAYFFIEILPDLLGTRTGWKARKAVNDLISPNRDLKRASNDFEMADTVENSSRLAAEHLAKEQFQEAKALYDKCLSGIHEDDPHLMYGRAQAEYGLEEYEQVRHTLDTLIKLNPDFKNVDAHLLYAKNLVKLNEIDLALKEFEVLDETFPGPEATYRYAKILEGLDRDDEAEALFEKILKNAKLSDKHYRSRYKAWIKLAKEALTPPKL